MSATRLGKGVTAGAVNAMDRKHRAAKTKRGCGAGCLCRPCVEESRAALRLTAGAKPDGVTRALLEMDPIGVQDRPGEVHGVSYTIQGGKVVGVRRYRTGECKRQNCVHCALERAEAVAP